MFGLPPSTPASSTNPRMFIQTNDHVVIHTEYGGEAKIIPFAGSGKPAATSSALGTSRAHWEGETLVVETTNLPASSRLRPIPALIVNQDAQVIERYTRVSKDGDAVLINGSKVAAITRSDRSAAHVPSWTGCGPLSDGAVFLLGDHPKSFDSRYFGPVSTTLIVGKAVPIATSASAP